MNKEQAKYYIKDQIKNYLIDQGINPNKVFRCLKKTHEDSDPSMSYDKARQKVHCFSCGADYDMFDLIGIRYDLSDNKEIFRKAYEHFGVTLDKEIPHQSTKTGVLKTTTTNELNSFFKGDSENLTVNNYQQFFIEARNEISDPDCLKYLEKRGISKETAVKYGLGYIKDWQSPKALRENKIPPKTPRIIIPTSDQSYTACDTRVEIPENQQRCRKMKEGNVHIFNLEAITEKKPCFITEGEFDALSFLELGYNALALGSTSNVNLFLKAIQDKEIRECLVIALDDDDKGRETTQILAEQLSLKNIKYCLSNLYKGYKDANELLVVDRKLFETRIQEFLIKELPEQLSIQQQGVSEEKEIKRQEYLVRSNASHLTEFRQSIAQSENRALISTGFKNLDNVLEGGLFEGLYVIGAISSLGKTTFAIQIADYLAQNDHEILYFSLEMSRYEIIAKSISRHTLLMCTERGMKTNLAKTTRGITVGSRYASYSPEEEDIIYTSGELYKEYAKNIFIIEGIGDIGVTEIKKAVEIHIEHTGKAPIVIIDYLQVISPSNIKASDKQNVDKAVLELKRISRDCKIPVIVISSLNRASYKDAISMEAFKESGAIEYSADVLMGLQLEGAGTGDFNVENAKSQEPRNIELKILKNRNGATGGSLFFYYYPKFNYFTMQKPSLCT